MEIEEIIGIIQAYDCALVEITGGEPLLQPSVHSLMQKLCDLDFEVLLETSGHHSLAPCDSRVKRIVDVKTPSSGAQESFLETNYDYLCATDEVKFVIADREDFDWALSIVREHKLVHRVANVHFSPVMFQEGNDYIQGCEALPPVILAEWILDAGEPVRLQMQLHRYIWAPDARGV
jgi:7-carboxy-7-deazaguanine synthase